MNNDTWHFPLRNPLAKRTAQTRLVTVDAPRPNDQPAPLNDEVEHSSASAVMKTICLLAVAVFGYCANAQYFTNFLSVSESVASPVYDVSGEHSGDNGAVSVTMQVTHNMDGTLTGTCVAEYFNGDLDLSATGPFRGKITSAGKYRNMTFEFYAPISGEDTDGISHSGTYRLSGSALLDPAVTPNFTGRAKGVACIGGLGCFQSTGDFEIPSGDGSWGVTFTNIHVAGRAITADAHVSFFETGREFGYLTRGSYNPSLHTAVLHLTGTNSAVGSKLTFTIDEQFHVKKATGRLLGQPVNYQHR